MGDCPLPPVKNKKPALAGSLFTPVQQYLSCVAPSILI